MLSAPAGLAIALAQPEFRGFSTATHSVALPELKPGTMCQPLIVSSIGRLEVARPQWPAVRHDEHAFQPLDFGNPLLGIHPPQSSRTKARQVKSALVQVRRSCQEQIPRLNRAPEDGPRWDGEEYSNRSQTIAAPQSGSSEAPAAGCDTKICGESPVRFS